MHKGCKLYVILALIEKRVAEGLQNLSMVRYFLDIFPEELPGMLLEREQILSWHCRIRTRSFFGPRNE
jgi:hypothetical protein